MQVPWSPQSHLRQGSGILCHSIIPFLKFRILFHTLVSSTRHNIWIPCLYPTPLCLLPSCDDPPRVRIQNRPHIGTPLHGNHTDFCFLSLLLCEGWKLGHSRNEESRTSGPSTALTGNYPTPAHTPPTSRPHLPCSVSSFQTPCQIDVTTFIFKRKEHRLGEIFVNSMV